MGRRPLHDPSVEILCFTCGEFMSGAKFNTHPCVLRGGRGRIVNTQMEVMARPDGLLARLWSALTLAALSIKDWIRA